MIHETAKREVSEMQETSLKPYETIKPHSELSFEDAGAFWKDVQNDLKKEAQLKEEPVTFYLRTRNESLENDRHPITGVEFKRKTIDLPNGDRVEGVFPEFDCVFETRIPEDLYLQSDKTQFRECNKQLYEAINNSPELRSLFSNDQYEQIHDGIDDGSAPDGYVWHHDAETGKLQLVDSTTHALTGHTGGRAVWGGGIR